MATAQLYFKRFFLQASLMEADPKGMMLAAIFLALAVGSAASGDFDQAQVLQKEAISVATRERTEVIGILREHLELFRNGRTVTEKAP